MKKYLALMAFVFLSLFSTLVMATTVADVKSELISQMQKDGYIGSKTASDVALKYVTPEDTKINVGNSNSSFAPNVNQTVSSSSHWLEYLSWINLIKVSALVFILIAARGLVAQIIRRCLKWIVAVPVAIYQITLLALSLVGTIKPELWWVSQAFYIALFCACANLFLIGWILETHPKLVLIVKKFFNIGVPFETVLSFWAMIYFGALAFTYHSSIFGFMAVVAMSGILSFSIYYSAGTLWLYFKENALSAVVFGHLIVLAGYITLIQMHVLTQYLTYFNVGLQYYATIALCVGLLVGSSPFLNGEKGQGLYALMFVVLAIAATTGYYFFDLKVMSSIVICFFILFGIEWIGYLGFEVGLIIGSGMVGGTLYALALLLEHYGSLIVLHLN